MSSKSNPNRPVMFPCATQVSLIEVGADDFDLKAGVSSYSSKSLKNADLKWVPPRTVSVQQGVKRPVIRRVSEGLTFTDEV